MWTGRSPVPILEVPYPNHLSCKPGLRTRYVITSPDKFLNRRIFYLCNPFTRNHANSFTVLFTRVRTNFGRYQYFIYLLYFLSKALTRHQAFAAQTVQNLRGSGVYTSPRKSRTVYRSQILTHFWSGQKPAHLAVQKLARFRGYPVNLRRLRAVFFFLFKNWPEPCEQVFISYIN